MHVQRLARAHAMVYVALLICHRTYVCVSMDWAIMIAPGAGFHGSVIHMTLAYAHVFEVFNPNWQERGALALRSERLKSTYFDITSQPPKHTETPYKPHFGLYYAKFTKIKKKNSHQITFWLFTRFQCLCFLRILWEAILLFLKLKYRFWSVMSDSILILKRKLPSNVLL